MLFGLALACFAGEASAQSGDAGTRARAVELSKKSRDAYRERRFDEAIALLREARSLTREPVLLYNLGRAYEGRGDLERAVESYEEYLREAPDADERDATARRIEALKRELAARTPPMTSRAAPAAAPTPAPALPPGAPANATPSVVPFVVAGLGLATIGAGAIVGLMARGAHSDAEADPSAEGARKSQESAESLALAANICLVAGAVFTAAGVVWTVIDRSADGKRTASLRILPTGIGGTF